VLITGTSLNGIGYEVARVVAKHANLVIITGYNAERLKLSEEGLKKEVPGAKIRTLTLDLSSNEKTRKAAAEVNAYSEPIHILINNAATSIGPRSLTVDGHESQFGTNYLGPWLFTNLIAPKLIASKTDTFTPRVINISSGAHAFGAGVIFDDLKLTKDYTNFLAYFQSKSAQILHAVELSKRSGGKINAYSLHPGVIWTNINQNAPVDTVKQLTEWGMLDASGKPTDANLKWKTIPQGAATTVTAAFDPSLNDKPGAYLDDSNVATPAPHSSDPANAEKLWNISEELVGQKFTF